MCALYILTWIKLKSQARLVGREKRQLSKDKTKGCRRNNVDEGNKKEKEIGRG